MNRVMYSKRMRKAHMLTALLCNKTKQITTVLSEDQTNDSTKDLWTLIFFLTGYLRKVQYWGQCLQNPRFYPRLSNFKFQ